jgi:hypothetical protein
VQREDHGHAGVLLLLGEGERGEAVLVLDLGDVVALAIVEEVPEG